MKSLRETPYFQELTKKLKDTFLELYERISAFKNDIFYVINRGPSNYHSSNKDTTRERLRDIMAFVYKLCEDAEKEREYFLNYSMAAAKLKRAQLVLHFLKIDCFQRRALEEGGGDKREKEGDKASYLYSERDYLILQKFEEMIESRL